MSKIIIVDDGYDMFYSTIINTLKQDKLVIMPSDTIYGFLFKQSLEDDVREIKKRDKKPFLYLISSLDMLEQLEIEDKSFLPVLKKNWPGPFTFIIPSKSGKVGIRMPDWDVLLKIIDAVGEPLMSTSVNLSKNPTLNNIDNIVTEFSEEVDLIVNDTNFKGNKSSTIIDIASKKIIREGKKLPKW